MGSPYPYTEEALVGLKIVGGLLLIISLAAFAAAMIYQAPKRRLYYLVTGMVVGMISMALLASCSSSKPPSPTPVLTPVAQETRAVTPVSPLTSPLSTPTATPGGKESVFPLKGRIAYHSDRAGNFDIWVIDLATGENHPLTTNKARDIEPDWSPDGTRLVFSTGRDDPENLQLYVMRADGSDQRPLLKDTRPYDNWSPAWSPDGTRIAFQTNRDVRVQGFDLYVVNADGTGERPLVVGPGNQYHVDWSPDGHHIVYVDDRDGDGEIYVADADGRHPKKLTDNFAAEKYPHWSPDGRWILFQSNREGLWRLYIMRPDGSEVERISVPLLANDEMGAWSPDGRYIVFTSDRAQRDWELYVMPLHEEAWQRLTFNFPQIKDRHPVWTK